MEKRKFRVKILNRTKTVGTSPYVIDYIIECESFESTKDFHRFYNIKKSSENIGTYPNGIKQIVLIVPLNDTIIQEIFA